MSLAKVLVGTITDIKKSIALWVLRKVSHILVNYLAYGGKILFVIRRQEIGLGQNLKVFLDWTLSITESQNQIRRESSALN